MNCEKRDECPVYARHSGKLCERLYCQDACPKPRDIDPRSGMAKAAKAQKGKE